MRRVEAGKAVLYHIQPESPVSDFTLLSAHKRTVGQTQADSVSDHVINALKVWAPSAGFKFMLSFNNILKMNRNTVFSHKHNDVWHWLVCKGRFYEIKGNVNTDECS